MRRSPILLVLGVFLAVGCTTSQSQTDPSGLVPVSARGSARGEGNLYAHPTRSIDDYDDILVGDVNLTYAPRQEPLSHADMQNLRNRAYEVVMREVPAAGQLAVVKPGPCTVKLDVQLASLQLPKPGSRHNGSTTVIMEFRDSLTGDPVVRYQRDRELAVGADAEASGPDIERLTKALEIVAEDMRVRFRDVLPLNATGARAAQGCKGTIGKVRAQAKAAVSGR